MSLYKLFKLPGPADLGMSPSNHFMPSKHFSDGGSPTWEDYHNYIQNNFPIRYFFADQLPSFVKYKVWNKLTRPFVDAHYWVVSHTIRKYHMLDLRQPKGEFDNYRYGWSDVPEKMLYAMFNLLKEYFDEDPADVSTAYSPEEIEADPCLKNQHANFQEAKALLHWWQVERKQNQKAIDKAWDEYLGLRPLGFDHPSAKEKRDKVFQMEQIFENKTTKMLIRLVVIRNSLWT